MHNSSSHNCANTSAKERVTTPISFTRSFPMLATTTTARASTSRIKLEFKTIASCKMTQLRILSQMCQTVNDIEQVRLDLQKLPTSLKFDEIVASIHESQVSVNTHTPLQPIMSWLTKTFFLMFRESDKAKRHECASWKS